VTADHENPVERWNAIRDWYDEFASSDPAWEHLRPMVELAAWVAEQSGAGSLYPVTSHQWLCVKLKPGHVFELDFFACAPRHLDGQFECTLSVRGRQIEKKVYPIAEAKSAFWNFVRRLESESSG
jgi:hypothetical protein